MIGEESVNFRYPIKVLREMATTAGEKLFGIKGEIGIDYILANIGKINVLVYLIMQGRRFEEPKFTTAQAEELLQKYIDAADPDDSTRLTDFINAIGEAVNMGLGIDLKKVREKKRKPEQDPETETESEDGSGTTPTDEE